MKFSFTLKSFIAFFFLFITTSTFCQWNPNPAINTPVCTFSGKQVDPRMDDDGHHGVFVAWKDYRTGVPDIYIQRVDSSGYPLWTTNGVVLCNDPADQSTPSITTDMKGGAIVAWSDWRSGIERDVYAQRITKNGVVKWTINGVGVANKPEREHNEKIISDGNGGAIIVWEQQSSSTFWWDIWAQHIDSMGNAMWPVGGIPIATVTNYRLNPKAQKDGRGGMFVTWQEYNFDYDIRAQHIDKFGNLLWGAGGILVCNASGTQTNPKIDPDSVSHGVVIAWEDERSFVDYDIYSQRIDSMGNLLWGAAGKPVVTFSGHQSAVDIFSNPKVGGTIYAWKDKRSGSYDIYAQRLDLSGNPQWTLNGIILCNSIYDQLNPNICGDSNGGAIVAWQDSSAGQLDVYSQRLDKNGNIQWASNGIPVGIASGDQVAPKNTSDGFGGSIYVFQDKRSGTSDIYVHRIFSNGGSVGVKEMNGIANAECYPNPFENNFTVSLNLKKEENISAKIYNASAQLVAEPFADKLFDQGNTQLNINTEQYRLPAGFYFLELKSESSCKQIKLIKTK